MKDGYITTYECMIGWKAVHLWWNPEMGGFWEPWQTSYAAFKSENEAIEEAKSWAEEEGIEYRERKGK